jgi:AmmeMemoRadiSam system protein A
MARSPSHDAGVAPAHAEQLLDIAETAIVLGLQGRGPVAPDVSEFPDRLCNRVGAFVTLTVGGALNGCIGTIEGSEPLGAAVARLAWSAAFADPRLPALRVADYAHLTIEISILSTLTPIEARSLSDLRERVRPAVDGLVIEAGSRRGLFLPSVWEQLPDPDEFLDRLYRKAGIAPRSWPPGMQASRFTTETHSRQAREMPARSARD